MLKKGQKRKHPDDYRHARGCPLDDNPLPAGICTHPRIIRYRKRRMWDRCRDCGARREYRNYPPSIYRKVIPVMERADDTIAYVDVTSMSGTDVPQPWLPKK